METIINLLISAVTLLTMVQGNTNLPPDFKNTAITIANNAIAYAQTEIANQNKVVEKPIEIPQITIPSLPEPQLGSINTPIDKSEIIASVVQKINPTLDTPLGTYIVRVRVNDKDGKTHKGDIVDMEVKDNLEVNETSRITEGLRSDRDVENNIIDTYYHTFFVYSPSSTGDKFLKFTSNGMSKELNINVK